MKAQSSYASLLKLFLVFVIVSPVAGQTGDARPAGQTPASASTPQRQTPAPAPSPQASDDDVVRISSNLVQFDAVVTNKNGKRVTDLRAEDFEVLVDGKRQEIANFAYISNATGEAVAPPPAGKRSPVDTTAPPLPPTRLRPEQARRTIALVVDDLGTSFESTHYVREALKKFVDQQMQPGDLAAIIRTSAGVGALQQFTTDKRMLYAAIERVRWNPSGRAGVSAFAAIAPDPLAQARQQTPGAGGGAGGDDASGGSGANSGANSGAGGVDEFREEIFSVGTLGALNYVIRGLKELPGRKSVIMFSDGFSIVNKDEPGFNQRILESLRRLTDLANRASVVVYTVDARGLQTVGLTAADDTSGMTSAQIEQSLSDRRNALFDTQDGMNYLSQQTGGFLIKNSNDLAGGVRKVLEDQQGYYLIGFKPSEDIFDAARGRVRFNKLQVKLARAGLRVRTRGGFYGFDEEDARPVRRTRGEQLMAALTSPFSAGEVPVRLTSLYGNEGEKADFLNSLLYIDVSNFKFEEEPDGWRKAVFDVVALTFGADGKVIQELDRTETVRARGDALEAMLRGGLIYTMKVPVKKSGAYQLRVAVRDTKSERVGAASQFVEIPNLKKNRLTLSGVIMQGVAPNNAPAAGQTTAPPDATGAGQQPTADPMSAAAVRRFKQNSQADFFYFIYNAKLDPATRRPQLTTQFRLFRDGKIVHTGAVVPFDPGQQSSMSHLQTGTRIRFNTGIPPGEYILQVIVTDALVKDKKHSTATQWIDFEVVK